MNKLIELVLTNPIIRAFLMEVAFRVFSEFYVTLDSDPKYRAEYTRLSIELAKAKTAEEKKNALKALLDIRAPKPPDAN